MVLTQDHKRKQWLELLGDWKYMSYVVADFDPIRFKEIYNSCSHEEISEAYRTKIAYESYETSK